MDRSRPPFYIPILLAFAVLVASVLLAPIRIFTVLKDTSQRLFSGSTRLSTTSAQYTKADMASPRTPVYYFSHGGPNIMYEREHPVYSKLQQIGKEITQKVKPSAVVVFSAHWQGSPDVIEVNAAEQTDLIYDFYGFPAPYYKAKYPHKGSKPVAEKVISLLNKASIKTVARSRGLDHGVWASFSVAFDPKTNPLNVPIVQVSLFDNEDPDQHYRLGAAISSLRDENIQIIVSGMAVHNLRDMRYGFDRVLPYTASFDEALKEAATAKPVERQDKMRELLMRSDARKAHPTFDHLLPIHVGAGAAGNDVGVRLWTKLEGSLSWALYRFGEIPGQS